MFSTKTKLISMQAIVLGGSGQVGLKLVEKLVQLPECSRITLVSRRPLDEYRTHEKINVRVVADMDNIAELDFDNHNAAFMLMGLGQPSKHTKDELERVDALIPIAFARACQRNKVPHMSVLSAVGADASAQYSNVTKTAAGGGWYCHVKGIMEDGKGKGKMEHGIKAMAFESVVIVQPAGIYPGNNNTPSFFGWLNEKLNPILPGKFETASSWAIAECMVQNMKQQLAGCIQGTKVICGGKDIKASSPQSA
jgi:nucleoside-diphosphate-sugar epimerase